MTNPQIINPDSVVLNQLDGPWQELAMMILWKLNGDKPVNITAKDMESLLNHFNPGIPVLMVMGTADSLTFQVIDENKAQVLAEHEANQRGRA